LVAVLVAADRLAGDPVDRGQAVDPAAREYRVHGRGRDTELAGDLHRPEPFAPLQPGLGSAGGDGVA
jgi:hypothetical protein